MCVRRGKECSALIIRQTLSQSHVEPKILEHVRVSPAFKVLFLPLREGCLAAAGQFSGRRRAPEPVQITHAAGGQRIKRRTGSIRQQSHEAIKQSDAQPYLKRYFRGGKCGDGAQNGLSPNPIADSEWWLQGGVEAIAPGLRRQAMESCHRGLRKVFATVTVTPQPA